MLWSTFKNILFTTWYKSNVKNLEIYCQRLKKLLLQHCECAYKHSQTFYDPMNLQKQLLHIVQHWQDICFIFWPKWYKNKHNRATITSFKENISLIQAKLNRKFKSNFHLCFVSMYAQKKGTILRVFFINFWSRKTNFVIWE